MEKKTKVKDRLSEDPEDNTYIHGMSLPESKVWIRYRGKVIAGVKANFKDSHINNLCCRFCQNEVRDDPARAIHDPYFTNDPIFRSCALKRASTWILGFADILEFVCGKMFSLRCWM